MRATRKRSGDGRGGDPPAHGRFLAGEVGALVGVSGTTIGQWARRGYIQSSQGRGDPRVYSVEDVAEAAVVAWLREQGVGHAQIGRAIERLGGRGRWPLAGAPLAVTVGAGPRRIALHEPEGTCILGDRGWQLAAAPPALRDAEPRLRRS